MYAFDGKRRSGTSIITGLGKGFVRFSQNAGIGTGSGLCFGDSGSPQIDHATQRVISVTSGGNGQCNANNYNYRVDTPQAREFLGPIPEPLVDAARRRGASCARGRRQAARSFSKRAGSSNGPTSAR